MKHRVAGRKLGRTSEHRLALLRNLSSALFKSEKERIETTLAKAKELRPFAERLVTLSKRETLHARRMVLRHIRDRQAVSKLFDVLSARYAQRPGGYTRILKLGPRRGDNAEMAIIELVGAEDAAAKTRAEAAASKAEAGDKGGRAAKAKAKARKAAAASEAAPAEGESKRRKTKSPGRKKASQRKDASEPAGGAKSKKKSKSPPKRRGSKPGDED
jgi:large subunit ribosomal protein L17